MLTIIENENEIKIAQKQFSKKLLEYCTKKIFVNVGFQGGNEERDIFWSNELDVGYSYEKFTGSRYWNAFGIKKPKEGSNVTLTCEINIPLKNINRKIGAAFAKDKSGEIYLIHRGKIGGGREGIGKNLFIDNYRGKWVEIEDGDHVNEVALIGSLNSTRFIYQIKNFVYEVDRVKKMAIEGESESEKDEFDEEYEGNKSYNINKNINAECDHGIIVNELANILEKKGYKVRNKRACDLFIKDRKDRIKALFEIKTNICTTSIYTAIGQLLLNSINLPNKPFLVLTIPELPHAHTLYNLKKLNINILVFNFVNNKVTFKNLNAVLF